MRRLRCLVVIGALAVAVCAVAAGPALAAKGGNSDTAHRCQQGGHEHMFEAETGRPFKNAGDCVSHAARGGDDAQLFIDPVFTLDDACTVSAGCWGVLEGVNLDNHAQWDVFWSQTGTTTPFASGVAEAERDGTGTVDVNVNLPCVNASTTAYAVDTTDGITTQTVTSPAGC
jgi:hypothetical protein